MNPRFRILARALPNLTAVLLTLSLAVTSCSPTPSGLRSQRVQREGLYLPDQLNDPIEPINRGVWAVNHGLVQGILVPASRGYRWVIPAGARHSINHFGYNLGFPVRAVNQVLQGRIGDAGDESVRFVTNTTVGVLGFFDVASKWEIPKHRGNFAQTFHVWGWDGENFIVLPVFGPSDEASALGLGADRLADPVAHYQTGRGVMVGTMFNDRSEQAESALRILKSDPDSYATAKAIWTYASRDEAPDWSMNGPLHEPSLETLAVATLRLQDQKFLERMRVGKARVPSTGRKLPFSYWLQKEQAPLVYVVPGLGSHRMTMQSLSVAEGLYDRGYSVVAISGLFHPEFIEYASSAEVPGNATADRRDLWSALEGIDTWMHHKHGERLGSRGMVGCSMGGFQALAMAVEAKTRPGICDRSHKGCVGIEIDQFLAVNPPVDLFHAMAVLDSYQEAPAEWPAAVRQQRVNNSVHKAVALMTMPKGIEIQSPCFDGTESRYLIGLTFRLSLRNAIYTSQRCHDLGNLERPLSWWNREAIYDEILGLSYADYLEQIALPHFQQEGVSEAAFHAESNLKHLSPGLARCPQAQVITSRNDFLLSDSDVAWLQATFGTRRLTLLERGGHMGGLADPKVHDLIASKLAALKAR